MMKNLPPRPFRDRSDAGQRLARDLEARIAEQVRGDLLVIGLARGGVPVAAEIARTFHASLDVCVVRKLRAPYQPELAVGAIAGPNVRVLNRSLIQDLMIDREQLERIVHDANREREEIEHSLLTGIDSVPIARRRVVLVDDGWATGASMHAAVSRVQDEAAASVIVAVPVAPTEARAELARRGIGLVADIVTNNLRAVGYWYEAFPPVDIAEVRELLAENRRAVTSGEGRDNHPPTP